MCAVSADNLASLAMGGFKESCSALRLCRHCMTTRDESQSLVNHVENNSKFDTHTTNNMQLPHLVSGILTDVCKLSMYTVLLTQHHVNFFCLHLVILNDPSLYNCAIENIKIYSSFSDYTVYQILLSLSCIHTMPNTLTYLSLPLR